MSRLILSVSLLHSLKGKVEHLKDMYEERQKNPEVRRVNSLFPVQKQLSLEFNKHRIALVSMIVICLHFLQMFWALCYKPFGHLTLDQRTLLTCPSPEPSSLCPSGSPERSPPNRAPTKTDTPFPEPSNYLLKFPVNGLTSFLSIVFITKGFLWWKFFSIFLHLYNVIDDTACLFLNTVWTFYHQRYILVMSDTTMHMFSCSCEPPLPCGHDRPIGGIMHFGKCVIWTCWGGKVTHASC